MPQAPSPSRSAASLSGVVFLRQLPSGLLLVTGPFKVNGVPLRRVNQAYVIATSTKVDISSVAVPAAAQEDSFYTISRAEKDARRRKRLSGEEAFFGEGDVPAVVVSDEQKAAQRTVDEALLKLPEFADDTFKAYIKARFSLRRGQYPHQMAF